LLLGHRDVHAEQIAAGELIVIEVVIAPRGIPLNRVSISASESMATPQWPISPRLVGASESCPIRVGMSKATESPVWPFASRYLYRRLVSLSRGETRELAHGPQAAPVAAGVDAASVGILAGELFGSSREVIDV